MINIKSILDPKRAYRVCGYSSDNWSTRGNAPFCCNILSYDTYGDGLTQHSGAYVAQFADTTDICLSVAKAILDDPKNEEWRKLDSFLYRRSDSQIRFALSVKYLEGKRQFYSMNLEKLTRADKGNDRRYEKVESWHDGGAAATLSLLISSHMEWLERLYIAERLRDLNYKQNGCFFSWEQMLPPTTELRGDWQQSFVALINALKAVNHLESTGRVLECALNNSRPQPTEQPTPEPAA